MTRFIKWLLPLFALLLSPLFARVAQAKTFTAASCNQSDVQAAINSAANGDTVIVPNGSCTWSGNITTSKQITLQGASVGGVVITDTNPNAASGGACTTGALLCFTIGSSFHTIIANLKFVTGAGVGNGDYIDVTGTGLPPLMHDMSFNIPNFVIQHAVQWLVAGGVIWNTTFISTDGTGACLSVGSDSGSLVVKSSLAWDTASTMGTLDDGMHNLYIEDSTFNEVGQAPDLDDNARVVIRHSQFIGSSGLTHGTSGPQGGRFIELYDNAFTFPNGNRTLNRYFWWRAGTGVVTGNSFQLIQSGCVGTKNTLTVTVENASSGGQHGCCTGWQCFHQPGTGSDGQTHSPSNLGSGNPSQGTENFQISDPIYIWGNTGTGQGSSHYGTNDNAGLGGPCSNGVTTTNFYISGRDFFYDDTGNPASGAKPGWARFTYPHPLRGTSSSGAPAPPTNLAASVQ